MNLSDLIPIILQNVDLSQLLQGLLSPFLKSAPPTLPPTEDYTYSPTPEPAPAPSQPQPEQDAFDPNDPYWSLPNYAYTEPNYAQNSTHSTMNNTVHTTPADTSYNPPPPPPPQNTKSSFDLSSLGSLFSGFGKTNTSSTPKSAPRSSILSLKRTDE